MIQTRKANIELEKMITQYINGDLDPEKVDELWVELIKDGDALERMITEANVKAIIQNRRKKPWWSRLAAWFRDRTLMVYGNTSKSSSRPYRRA